jgi:hypothetical protein
MPQALPVACPHLLLIALLCMLLPWRFADWLCCS